MLISNSKNKDIVQPHNSWEFPESIEGKIRDLALDRMGYARNASSWYRRKKRSLQRISKGLRGGAIILLSLGGVAPLFTKASLNVDPYVGYVLLALGGALLLADRIFGISSGWARFMVAAVDIEAKAEVFRVKIISAAYQAKPSSNDNILQLCLEFTELISACIVGETKTWVSEFNQGRDELGKLTKGQMR